MERVSKSKKLSDTRRLLRLCFTRLPPATQVPLEVWRNNVVLETDLRTMTLLAQTCKAFWELVEEIRRCNVRVALVYRQYDQIPLARRCLKMCARNGVAEAMFHLGYAKRYGGFGVGYSEHNNKWIGKAAQAGSYIAMAIYGHCFKRSNPSIYNFWVEKVIASNDALALGYHFYANCDLKKAFPFLEKSAKEGNEHGQYWFSQVSKQEKTYWLTRAAEQGFYKAMCDLSSQDFSKDLANRAQKQSGRCKDDILNTFSYHIPFTRRWERRWEWENDDYFN